MPHICTSTNTCVWTHLSFEAEAGRGRWSFAHSFRAVLGDVAPSKHCPHPPWANVPLLPLPLMAERVMGKRYVCTRTWWVLASLFPKEKGCQGQNTGRSCLFTLPWASLLLLWFFFGGGGGRGLFFLGVRMMLGSPLWPQDPAKVSESVLNWIASIRPFPTVNDTKEMYIPSPPFVGHLLYMWVQCWVLTAQGLATYLWEVLWGKGLGEEAQERLPGRKWTAKPLFAGSSHTAYKRANWLPCPFVSTWTSLRESSCVNSLS